MKFVVVLTSRGPDSVQRALQLANYAYMQGDQVRVFLWETRDELNEMARETLLDWEQGETQPLGPAAACAVRPMRTAARSERDGAARISEFYSLVKAADQIVTF